MNEGRPNKYALGQFIRSVQATALRVDRAGGCRFADESELLSVDGLDEDITANFTLSKTLLEEVLQEIPDNIDLDTLVDAYEFETEITSWSEVKTYLRVRILPSKDNQGEGDGYILLCYDITGQKVGQLALERETSSLGLLLACSNMANRANEFKVALADCMEIICSYQNWLYSGWLVAHAYLVDDIDPDKLFSSNIWCCKDREFIKPFIELTMNTPLKKGVGIAGEVLETGKPIWHGRKSSYPDLPRAQLADECNLVSLVAIPVVAGERVVSVLEFFADDERPPNDQLLEVLVAVGRELGSVYDRENTNKQLKHLADHDALTGLVVARVIYDRIDQALTRVARNKTIAAVLFIDLDGFKQVNDEYGHDVGDGLLIHVAGVLANSVREVDSVARFGGDEFIILLSDLNTASGAEVVAEKIFDSLRRPVFIGGHKVQVGASIGICICSEADKSVETILKLSDAAMYRAKHAGKNRFVISD